MSHTLIQRFQSCYHIALYPILNCSLLMKVLMQCYFSKTTSQLGLRVPEVLCNPSVPLVLFQAVLSVPSGQLGQLGLLGLFFQLFLCIQ